MPQNSVKTLFNDLQDAMASPETLVWWLAELEYDHPTVVVECKELWEKVDVSTFPDTDVSVGWRCRPEPSVPRKFKATIVSVGVDFHTRDSFSDRTFFVLLCVPGRRKLQKVYLSSIISLDRPRL